MDVSSVQRGRRPGQDNAFHPWLDYKQIFFANLQLLGFDAAAMEMKYKIPFNKEMFNFPNKAGSEAVLYFLFNRLNPTMCQQEFRDCWPVTDKKSEAAFRKICCIWLQNIQKEETDAKLPRINASLFLSPGGDKFCHLVFAFSTFVILHVIRKDHGVKDDGILGYPTLTPQNKELGDVMETTVNCAAIRHRKQFLETLGQTASVKQSWQTYADEVTKELRSLTKELRELDREKRDQIQMAAQNGRARGSPIPASCRSHDFDMSEHTARRAHRVQQVRGLWKELHDFLEQSLDSRDIVNSVIDKTQEKFSIDAANIQITIPHLMQRECEQEMRRRQVENIYEGGELNLESVLQLWNLSLRMYIQRLQQGGLKDLSDEANDMKSQAHALQGYLANTSVLRERMAREVPQRKKTVARLRGQFRSAVMTSGPGMMAPSPPVTFDPPRGHHGTTPTGPVGQMSPDQAETPEAALNIANYISETSRKPRVESFQSRAFGLTSLQNRNENRSNKSGPVKLPQVTQRSVSGGSSVSKQQSKSASGRGKTGIQPRVVRHISKQPASSAASTLKLDKKSAPGKDRTPLSSSQPLASTSEKTSRTQPVDLDKTPVPLDYNIGAAETARDRAHNMLAEEIVWAVMHGDEEDGGGGLPHELSITSPRSAPVLSAWDRALPSTSLPQEQAVISASLVSDRDSPTPLHSQTTVDSQHNTKTSTCTHASSLRSHRTSDGEDASGQFMRSPSPVTLVQQARLSEFEDGDVELEDRVRGVSTQKKRTEGDGGEHEAEDMNAENPVASQYEVFMSHDLIHSSPVAMDIHRMWQEMISEDQGVKEENKDSSSDKDLAADWMELDRSISSAHTLTPKASQSSGSSDASAYTEPTQADAAPTRPRPGQQASQGLSSQLLQQCAGGEAERSGTQYEEGLGGSASQTMINNTVAFITSFEEDSDQPAPGKAEDSTVEWESTIEWEEHLSALYDDEEEGETSDGNGNFEDGSGTAVAVNPALKSFFENKTSVVEGSIVPSRTDSLDKFTLPGYLSSPVVSFMPQRTLSGVDGGEAPQAMGSEDLAACDTGSGLPGSRSSSVRYGHGGAMLSPKDSSDKENCSVENTPDLTTQSSAKPRHALVDSVGTTKQKENSVCNSHDDTTGFERNDFDKDDLPNAADASPNDSFTPLRCGLLVQGKSPARGQSALRNSSPSLFPTASSESLDEKLAAQLNRLRRLKAEAFKGLEIGKPGDESETRKEADDAALSSVSVSSASRSTVTGGREVQPTVHGSGPLDIFGEDDSILLPASP